MTREALSKSQIFRHIPESGRRGISIIDAIISNHTLRSECCDEKMKQDQIRMINAIETHIEDIDTVFNHIDDLSAVFQWDTKRVEIFKSLYNLTKWNLRYNEEMDPDEKETLIDNNIYHLDD
jgi:hypothetical protein